MEGSIKQIVSQDALDQVKNLNKELDILVQKLMDSLTNATKFDAVFKSAKGPVEYEKALKDNTEAQRQFIAAGNQVKETLVKQEAAQKVATDQTNSLTKALKETVTIIDVLDARIDENAKRLAENKIALEQNRKVQADLKQLYKDQVITLDQYSTRVAKLIKDEAGLRVVTSELTQEQTQFAKSVNAVEQSFDKGSIVLGRIRDEYRKLTDLEKNAPFGQSLKRAIDQLDPAIKKADATIGNFQRSVGNYPSAFNGLNNSIQQVLREAPSAAVSLNTFFLAISNNLPIVFDELSRARQTIKATNEQIQAGATIAKEAATANALLAGSTLEVATAEGLLAEKTALANAQQTKAPSLLQQVGKSLFSIQSALTLGVLALTLFGGKLFEFIGNLFKTGDAADKLTEKQKNLAESQKNYNNALKESNSAYAKAAGEVALLTEEVDLAKKGFINKTDVIKQYNETIGKTVGQVKTLDEVEQALVKNGDAYILFTLKKSAATLLFNKAAQEAANQETSQIFQLQKNIKDRGELQGKFVDQNNTTLSQFYKGTTKIVDESNKSKENILNAGKKLLVEAGELAKKFKFDFNGDAGRGDKAAADGAKKAQEETKKSAKAAFDDLKADAEERIKIFKAIADNENNNYYLRIVGLENYQEEEKKLIEAEQKYLLSVPKITAGEILKINGDAERQLKALTFEAGQERIAIIKKNADDEKAIREQFSKEINDKSKLKDLITNNTNDPYLKFAENNALQYKIDIENLNKSLQQKKITITEYNEQKNKIEEKYEELGLSNQIENTKALIDNLKGQGIDVADLLKKQSDLEMMYSDLTTEHFIENEEKKAAKRKEIQDKSLELFSEISKLFETVVLGGYDREKNAIQEQIDALDKQKEKDIEVATTQKENIDGTLVTEEQRADRIAVINTKAQAQKEALERRQRQIDLERARFEKAFNIGQIIAKTAIAIVEKLPGLPFTAPLIAIIAAIGAAQLATVLATPIPKFAKGGTINKDSLVMYGEEGVEKVDLPDGRSFLTPDKPTIDFLPKGTVITSNPKLVLEQAKEMAFYNSLRPIQYTSQEKTNHFEIKALENKMDQMINAIKNKPVAHITNTWKGVQTSFGNANGWTEYINTYVKS